MNNQLKLPFAAILTLTAILAVIIAVVTTFLLIHFTDLTALHTRIAVVTSGSLALTAVGLLVFLNPRFTSLRKNFLASVVPMFLSLLVILLFKNSKPEAASRGAVIAIMMGLAMLTLLAGVSFIIKLVKLEIEFVARKEAV